MIPLSSHDDAQYRAPIYGPALTELVRIAARPSQQSLDDLQFKGLGVKERMVFRKPNRLPRSVRNTLANAQRPNNMISHHTYDKDERDRLYQEYKSAGRPGVVKSSTNDSNGKIVWVVAWSR